MTATETFFAQPYDLEATGFYFKDLEDYENKFKENKNSCGHPVEEYELQYIDGDDAKLFEACRINQCNISLWLEEISPLNETEKAALYFLLSDLGYSINDALAKVDDVCLSECPLVDAATDLFNDCYLGEIPENIRFYINYEAFARDCRLGGDMIEFDYNGTTYTCTNANGI